MSIRGRLKVTALALALLAVGGRAQHVVMGNPTGHVLVSTQFRTTMTYEAALAKLSEYYEEQIGRKIAVALPEIGPRQHYDVWHDIWVDFGPETDKVTVTMKRGADSITNRLVKSWMLSVAGRLGAAFPLQYKELPAPLTSEMEIFATQRDVASILQSLPGMKSLATWQHLAMVVDASPMMSVVMERAGLHGIHRLMLTAENVAAMRQLTAALTQSSQRPCICAVYSEMVELDAEIAREAESKSALIGTHTAGTVYNPEATKKHEQDAVRAEPEMKKRVLEASGYYDVKFRPDKAYSQVTVTWTELQGFVRETGTFEGQRVLGRTPVANARPPAVSAPPLNARCKLAPLQPGAYRIRLEGAIPGGQPVRIDERTFWFDGKTFEEL